MANGPFTSSLTTKIPRAAGQGGIRREEGAENFAYMLTHPPSAAEMQKLLPLMGIFTAECSKGTFKLVETLLRQRPELHAQVASSVLSFLGSGKTRDKWRRR